MTYEYAVYFKLLLLCGYKDEMEQYIDNALVEQNPLSDVILELSTVGADDKKILSVLNEYIMQVNDSDIDYKTVFDLVMSFLNQKYVECAMPMKDITDLMRRIAVNTERYFDDPWHTMYLIGDLFSEAEEGYIDKNSYQREFDAFLFENICYSDYPIALPKETLFKKIIKKIRKNTKHARRVK